MLCHTELHCAMVCAVLRRGLLLHGAWETLIPTPIQLPTMAQNHASGQAPDSTESEESSLGSAVRWLQASLLELGFLTGVPGDVFEARTLEAVRDFQHAEALEPDGLVGPRTKIQLYRSLPRYLNPILVEEPDRARQSG